MAWIRIDTKSNTPAYEQIVSGIKYAIARGEYRPEDQLPSVRELAVELLVNPNTVAKAYRELERERLTYSRKGAGIYVTDGAGNACRKARREEVTERVGQALREATRSGLSPDELRRIVERELRDAMDAESEKH